MKRQIAFFIYLTLFIMFCASGALSTCAQTGFDKDAAIITDGAGRNRMIKYSDLLFQLALQPGVPLDSPRPEDLKRALKMIINIGLIGLEIENLRVPCQIVTQAEVAEEIRRVAGFFSTYTEFEKRLQIIGFYSIKDENFERGMYLRAKLQKYINFRFRSFTIIPPEEEENYYRNVFAPEFRRKYPEILLPGLEEQRPQIRQILVEQKANGEITRFLEYAARRVKIVILSDELK